MGRVLVYVMFTFVSSEPIKITNFVISIEILFATDFDCAVYNGNTKENYLNEMLPFKT